jgi:putative membrane protein
VGWKFSTPYSFLQDVITLRGSAAPLIWGRVAAFGLWALLLALVHWNERLIDLNVEVAPFEAAGAALGVLLVMRTNAGYERWWEGRKLWGAIINSTRSLAIAASSYGIDDPVWRRRIAGRIAAFGHVCRRSLRGEAEMPEVVALLGAADARMVAESSHRPSAVARLIAEDLRAGLDDFAFIQADGQRVALIDEIGGCERIMRSPMPAAYAIEVRRFIFLFLLTLPLVLFEQLEKQRALWLAPLVELLVAYPFLAVDKIGHELQQPFLAYRLNHLPLDDYTAMIETNVLGLLDAPRLSSPESASPRRA